jgi:hypothetical protein
VKRDEEIKFSTQTEYSNGLCVYIVEFLAQRKQ